MNPPGLRLDTAVLDHILSLQLSIAWAGEGLDEQRLAWWSSDFTHELGAPSLFEDLLPKTQKWAGLQAVREVARRKDTALRTPNSDGDRLLTLFHLGFDIDEQIDQRLLDLKASGKDPKDALPNLYKQAWPSLASDETLSEFDKDSFEAWLKSFGKAEFRKMPSGRMLIGKTPTELKTLVDQLVAALLPLPEQNLYPMPHSLMT